MFHWKKLYWLGQNHTFFLFQQKIFSRVSHKELFCTLTSNTHLQIRATISFNCASIPWYLLWTVYGLYRWSRTGLSGPKQQPAPAEMAWPLHCMQTVHSSQAAFHRDIWNALANTYDWWRFIWRGLIRICLPVNRNKMSPFMCQNSSLDYRMNNNLKAMPTHWIRLTYLRDCSRMFYTVLSSLCFLF